MGIGGVGGALASLLKVFPAAWDLVVQSGTAPYWRGKARAMETLLAIKTDDYDDLLTIHQRTTSEYDALSARYRALQRSMGTRDDSPDSSADSPDSGANPSTRTPP